MTGSKTISKFRDQWLLGWIPLGVWTAAVVRGAVMPPEAIPKFLVTINDKLIHGTEYFILGLLAYNAFRKSSVNWIHNARFKTTIIYGMFLGALTEWLQLRVPGRSCDLQDWLADMAGIILAAGIIILNGKIHQEKRTAS